MQNPFVLSSRASCPYVKLKKIMTPILPRRRFLQSALALSAIPFAGAESAWDDRGERPIRVGVLGVAHSHAESKIRLLQQSDAYQFVGVCAETELLDARYRARNVSVFSESDLIEQCEVIVVESDVRDHADHAGRALEGGCHVHVEKPPSTTLESFLRLQELAAERKRILQVGYMWRFHPAFQQAERWVRDGLLGQVFMVQARINTFLDEAQRRVAAEFPGGILFELGCHLLDPMVRIMGAPQSVGSRLASTEVFPDTLADNCFAWLDYGRAQCLLTSAARQPNATRYRTFEILGTQGTLRIQPIEPPVLELDLLEATDDLPAGLHRIPLAPYQRYTDEFVALADQVRRGTVAPVLPETERIVHETLLRACQMV